MERIPQLVRERREKHILQPSRGDRLGPRGFRRGALPAGLLVQLRVLEREGRLLGDA